ncbi:MAG: MBL fold metallo-hydrolase [Acidimicrobiia bacterium]
MSRIRQLDRRTFLTEVGLGALAVVVIGAGTAACGGEPETSSPGSTVVPGGKSDASLPPTSGVVPETLSYRRVNLGFVSAYLLTRGTDVAIVDTGVEGSSGGIGDALSAAGRSWGDVRHLILTHHHPDHIGSLAEVAEMAGGAAIYAGAPDVPSIKAPREVRPVNDGDEVFGLRMVASPGHTLGHVAVLDVASSVLIVGDALVNTPELSGSPPQYTVDAAQARESVRKLAALDARTVLFGHGDPLEGNAAAALKALAASL